MIPTQRGLSLISHPILFRTRPASEQILQKNQDFYFAWVGIIFSSSFTPILYLSDQKLFLFCRFVILNFFGWNLCLPTACNFVGNPSDYIYKNIPCPHITGMSNLRSVSKMLPYRYSTVPYILYSVLQIGSDVL